MYAFFMQLPIPVLAVHAQQAHNHALMANVWPPYQATLLPSWLFVIAEAHESDQDSAQGTHQLGT